MKLALDTNGYRLVMDGDERAVRLVQQAAMVCLPVPVIAELRFGFLNGTRGKRNDDVLTRFLAAPRVEVLARDEATTRHYATLKLQLKKQGTPIPINDVWTAALVIQHHAVLFTLNADLDRLPQLQRV